MKDRNTRIKKLMDYVYLFEDYLYSGYKSSHPELQLSPPEIPTLPHIPTSKDKKLIQIKKKIETCKQCYLHYNRENAIAGEGNASPDIFIIGGGPDEAEDNAGKPFVGMTYNYLKKWLDAIHISLSDQVFCCNIVRCRSPQNREPKIDEIKTCLPYCDDQIILLKPKVILCLGSIPGQVFSDEFSTEITNLRGKSFFYKGIPLIITYHPKEVLQDSNLRKPVWEDLKLLRKILEEWTGK